MTPLDQSGTLFFPVSNTGDPVENQGDSLFEKVGGGTPCSRASALGTCPKHLIAETTRLPHPLLFVFVFSRSPFSSNRRTQM